MLKAFKYRIYPTATQQVLLHKHFGSARLVYNLALEAKTMAYAGSQVNLSCYDLIKQLPDLKKDCVWLKEVNSQSLQASIRNLDKAFKGFYTQRGGFPKYKSKRRGKQSFHIPQNVLVENRKLIIPKFKEGIKMVLHRETGRGNQISWPYQKHLLGNSMSPYCVILASSVNQKLK